MTHLGYCYVLAELATGKDGVVYNEPSLMVDLCGSTAPAFFGFASLPLPRAATTSTCRKAGG